MEDSEGNQREYYTQKRRGKKMNVQTALQLTSDEFAELANTCHGFNDEIYKNHQVHYEGESFGEFLGKGSSRIKNYSAIQGKLI